MASSGRLNGPGGAGRTPRRAPRRARWVLAALLVVPLLEITVIILVGQWIGAWWTFGTLLALSVFGAWLVRREGTRTWRKLQVAVRSGEPPARELSDAALVLVGGIMLLTPGFVTDVIGLFLVLPFTRPLTRVWLQRLVASRVVTVVPPSAGTPWRSPSPRQDDSVIEGEIVDDDPPHT